MSAFLVLTALALNQKKVALVLILNVPGRVEHSKFGIFSAAFSVHRKLLSNLESNANAGDEE